MGQLVQFAYKVSKRVLSPKPLESDEIAMLLKLRDILNSAFPPEVTRAGQEEKRKAQELNK